MARPTSRGAVGTGNVVPEGGTYTLLTPNDKEISMGFSRTDDDTTRVTLTRGRREFELDVTSTGDVRE